MKIAMDYQLAADPAFRGDLGSILEKHGYKIEWSSHTEVDVYDTKMKKVVVRGRTRCDQCDTEKEWELLVDMPGKPDDQHFIYDAIEKQNAQVVDPDHADHILQLHKTFRIRPAQI